MERDHDDKNKMFRTLKELIEAFEKMEGILEDSENMDLDFFLMEESEVLEYLKISRSTLYRHRKRAGLEPIAFFGRNVYNKKEIIKYIIKLILKKKIEL